MDFGSSIVFTFAEHEMYKSELFINIIKNHYLLKLNLRYMPCQKALNHEDY